MSSRLLIVPAAALLLFASVPASGADGAALFKAKCAMCHGPDGSGGTAMGKKLGVRPLGSAEVQKQTDAVLKGIITNGKGKMPAYGGKLSAEEVSALIAQIRTFAPK
jgi:mono/diheme cytochrome c family protein